MSHYSALESGKLRRYILILLALFLSVCHTQAKGGAMAIAAEQQVAYLAGGCFWGMEELVRQIPGVLETEVGYTGGNTPDATYWQVKTGRTGHAESLKIVFDPKRLTYRHLLFEFFRMHDPTTLNRQGNDAGTQYRSAIFTVNAEQQQIARDVIKTVDASGEWGAKVVTEVVPFKEFWRAEEYHQKYLVKYPQGYTCHSIRRMKLGE
jgi:methionine-S-sulfoxide reductase